MRRARPGWSAWLARRASSRSRRSTRARSSAACARTARCAARSARHRPRSCTSGRSPSRTSTGSGCSPSRASRRRRPRSRRARTRRTRVGAGPRVVVLDLGCKRSIVRRLAESGVEAVVVPGPWDADAVLALEPAGGADRQRPRRSRPARPGPSRPCASCSARSRSSASASATSCVRSRSDCATFKLPFGHRGANHPVRVTGSRRVLVTAQNHGFAVEPGEDASEVSHVSLNDGTVEGLEGDGFATLQFHPEAAPGPHDAVPFFDRIADGMPKRTDLRSILIVGSGPIRIGQGCEFDYAGVQACRVLRAEGYRVVLVNSNPATIMTDPEWADATYLEPLDAPTLAEIIERERPDALLPTLGGQTALEPRRRARRGGRARRARRRADRRRPDAIRRAEDRLALPRDDGGGRVCPCRRAWSSRRSTQLDSCPVPAVVRPAFTLGGRGGGIARTREELAKRVAHGLEREPDRPGARRALARGLAGVRARGRRRRGRQLRRRLLDREPRPDRRPHRRLVDGRAAADAARRRAAAPPRRRLRVRTGDRSRDRRRERPVRLRARRRASSR